MTDDPNVQPAVEGADKPTAEPAVAPPSTTSEPAPSKPSGGSRLTNFGNQIWDAVALPALAWGGFRLEKGRKEIGIISLATVFNVIALLLYFFALRHGPLSVIVTLTALYPVVSILLARVFLKETVSRVQALAIVLAMTGVALLAA